MATLHEANGRWHVRGVRLPDGAVVEEWWIADGVWHDRPIADTDPLPGGWFLPGGLVDAHAHLSMNFNGFELPDGSPALIAANLAAHRAAGVLAVRDAGMAWGGTPRSEESRVVWSSRLLAAPGRGYPEICAAVEADALTAVALDELRAGATWVKLMGDFPGPDGDWFAAPSVYPETAVIDLVQAVHAAGGRVLAHSTGQAAPMLIRAGVDSIEHGMSLKVELLREMAVRGTAWTLTLGTALKHVGPLAERSDALGGYIRGALETVRVNLAHAIALGVPLLVGTDELSHGALLEELHILHRFGLPPTQLLAAVSSGARRFIDLPGLEVGASADLVSYARDPRLDFAALAEPTAILLGGEPVPRR